MISPHPAGFPMCPFSFLEPGSFFDIGAVGAIPILVPIVACLLPFRADVKSVEDIGAFSFEELNG